MNYEDFMFFKKKWGFMTDKERWEFLSKRNEPDLIVMLDNDDTFVVAEGIEDEYLCFDKYIGCTDGIKELLKAMKITHEEV